MKHRLRDLTYVLHRPVETAVQSGLSTFKLCGVNEEQRTLHPNERITIALCQHASETPDRILAAYVGFYRSHRGLDKYWLS